MKAYLRYVPTEAFGVIASPQCTDVLVDPSGKLAITAALQDVCAFNLRLASKVNHILVKTLTNLPGP